MHTVYFICRKEIVVMQNSVAIPLNVYTSSSVTLCSNNFRGNNKVARPVVCVPSWIGVQ